MKRTTLLMSLFGLYVISMLAFFIMPLAGRAYYTADNFWTVAHEAPAWFLRADDGSFYGETTGGHRFSQRPVLPDSGVRLERFEIGSAFFYISDRGIIEASSDLVALSIYHTLS